MLIDGKAYAEEVIKTLREELSGLPTNPGIATVLVGGHGPARVYQRRIDRSAREVGMTSRMEWLAPDATSARSSARSPSSTSTRR